MMSSTSCCNPKELATAHVGPTLAGAPDQVTPARHGAARPTGSTADLLVVGDIVTNNPAAPTAEAMAISGGRIIGIGSQADVEGLVTSRRQPHSSREVSSSLGSSSPTCTSGRRC